MFPNVDNLPSATNLSEKNVEEYLDLLQNWTTKTRIPAMVYLLLLAVFGMLGNSFILYVYWRRYERTVRKVLMLVMAGCDLMSNCLLTPVEIYDMLHKWNFPNVPVLCRARVFLNVCTSAASCLLLLEVAAIRYQKICKPFGRQMSLRQTKMICLIIMGTALLAAGPTAIIYDRARKITPIHGIYGYECAIANAFSGTVWPLVYYGGLLLLYTVCCGVIIVYYVLIGLRVWKYRQMFGSTTVAHQTITRKSNSSQSETPTKTVKESLTISGTPADQRSVTSAVSSKRPAPVTSVMSSRLPAVGCSSAQVNVRTSVGCRPDSVKPFQSIRPPDMKCSSVSDMPATSTRRPASEKTANIFRTSMITNCEQFAHTRRFTSNLNDCSLPSKVLHRPDIHNYVSTSDTDIVNDKWTSQTGELNSRKMPEFPKVTETRIHQERADNLPDSSIELKTLGETRTGQDTCQLDTAKEQKLFSRTTCMLFTVTAIFIVSYVPHFVIMFFYMTSGEQIQRMNLLESALVYLLFKSYFLNSAVNPVIYSLWDRNFRRHCYHLIKCPFN